MTCSIGNHWKIVSNHETFRRTNFAIAIYKNQHILVAGGNDYDTGVGLKSVIMFHVQQNKIISLPDLPNESWTCTGAVLKDYFYISDHYNSFYRLDLSTLLQWEEVTMKLSDAFGNSIISNDEYLFTFGGRDKNGNLNCVCQSYDPNTNKWTALPQMNIPRYRHTTAIVGNKIYIIGGIGKLQKYLSSVEIFDISSQSWQFAPNLPVVPEEHNELEGFCVSCASTAVFERWIIVTGGRKRIRKNGRASRYCFVFDTFKNEWIQSSVLLPTSRNGHGSVFSSGAGGIAGGGSQLVSIGGVNLNSVLMMERQYFISNWNVIEYFVHLRKLVDDGRAIVKAHNNDESLDSDNNTVVVKLMTYLNMDTFRHTLSFLI